MSSRITVLCIPALVALVLPEFVNAQNQPQATPLAWQCVQEFDQFFHVLCAPRAPAVAVAGDPVMAPAAKVETAGLHPAADMRPVAQRGDPEVFSAEAWRVPLHSAPSDPARVTVLLESVLCGTRPACTVRYDSAPPRLARR